MPAFWPGGVAVNETVLKGDTEKQIAAIWLATPGATQEDGHGGREQKQGTGLRYDLHDGIARRTLGVVIPKTAIDELADVLGARKVIRLAAVPIGVSDGRAIAPDELAFGGVVIEANPNARDIVGDEAVHKGVFGRAPDRDKVAAQRDGLALGGVPIGGRNQKVFVAAESQLGAVAGEFENGSQSGQ
jgi:hypothetical protein